MPDGAILILTGSGVLISIVPDGTAIANEETIRVEGFTFDGNNAALKLHHGSWGGRHQQQAVQKSGNRK